MKTLISYQLVNDHGFDAVRSFLELASGKFVQSIYFPISSDMRLGWFAIGSDRGIYVGCFFILSEVSEEKGFANTSIRSIRIASIGRSFPSVVNELKLLRTPIPPTTRPNTVCLPSK